MFFNFCFSKDFCFQAEFFGEKKRLSLLQRTAFHKKCGSKKKNVKQRLFKFFQFFLIKRFLKEKNLFSFKGRFVTKKGVFFEKRCFL